MPFTVYLQRVAIAPCVISLADDATRLAMCPQRDAGGHSQGIGQRERGVVRLAVVVHAVAHHGPAGKNGAPVERQMTAVARNIRPRILRIVKVPVPHDLCRGGARRRLPHARSGTAPAERVPLSRTDQ